MLYILGSGLSYITHHIFYMWIWLLAFSFFIWQKDDFFKFALLSYFARNVGCAYQCIPFQVLVWSFDSYACFYRKPQKPCL